MIANRPEHTNKEAPVAGAPGFTIFRSLVGYAYAANGNTHNPTPRYRWTLLCDGQMVDADDKRAPLVQAARLDGESYRRGL
jgi:hypothetical protein